MNVLFNELTDEHALKYHGYIFSEEEDGSTDSESEFDELYERYKPPPLKILPEQIVVIKPLKSNTITGENFIKSNTTIEDKENFIESNTTTKEDFILQENKHNRRKKVFKQKKETSFKITINNSYSAFEQNENEISKDLDNPPNESKIQEDNASNNEITKRKNKRRKRRMKNKITTDISYENCVRDKGNSRMKNKPTKNFSDENYVQDKGNFGMKNKTTKDFPYYAYENYVQDKRNSNEMIPIKVVTIFEHNSKREIYISSEDSSEDELVEELSLKPMCNCFMTVYSILERFPLDEDNLSENSNENHTTSWDNISTNNLYRSDKLIEQEYYDIVVSPQIHQDNITTLENNSKRGTYVFSERELQLDAIFHALEVRNNSVVASYVDENGMFWDIISTNDFYWSDKLLEREY